ncbi:hypothetical protein FXN61_36340 [Lentzea sp. PSKA42]|uniref:Uncharacterized protein n=1 Tax=Lentzea indica TaxID=2604800 RepID=A0ABX1FT76_9PSEU|nr:hypothetical protein [Lentzea indica]NKE61940.1 hypothetical protein [Lentzea indica]
MREPLERDSEIAHIREALDAATCGEGRVVWVTRWELTGSRYLSDTTRQMVEGFNWFDMAK